MRTPILLIGLVLFLSSCSTAYKFATVSSDDTNTNEQMEFVVETDSIRVTYNFSGALGAIQITIFNKLNEGLLIDWRKSALILGDSPIVYHSPALRINGNIKTSLIQTDPTTSTSTLSATVRREEAREFIPPQSKIIQTGYYVTRKGLNTTSVNFSEEQNEVLNNGFTIRVSKANFTRSNSPLVFRSYLTFVSGQNESGVFTTSSSFYISQLIKGKGGYNTIAIRLGYSPKYYERKGNLFATY